MRTRRLTRSGFRLPACALAAMIGWSAIATAVEPDEVLADARLEQRARALSSELRCLVCQNQSIDDSNAPLARDLRIVVRERLKAGDSDGQVLDFVVARYGDFVLLRPRLAPRTIVLWSAPLLLLLIASWLALRTFGVRAPDSEVRPKPLSDSEKAELAKLDTERS